jgi:hypothetical protein
MWGLGADKIRGKGVDAVESIRKHMPRVFAVIARSKNGNVVVLEHNGKEVKPYWMHLEPSYREKYPLVDDFGYWDWKAYGFQYKDGKIIMNQVPQYPMSLVTREGRVAAHVTIRGQKLCLSHIWIQCNDSWLKPVEFIEVICIDRQGKIVKERISS